MRIHTRCKECYSVYEIRRIEDTVEAPISHCIFCGSTNIAMGDETGDYWMSLAIDAGLPARSESRDVILRMFETWSPGDGDPIRFIDFAREMVKASSAETLS